MKKIHLICAARPNFVKLAPLFHALKNETWCQTYIIHTGQHYDAALSDIFFKELKLPIPHFNLNIGSGTHAEQTGKTMMAYEVLLIQEKPDFVIVFGDVNATLACTIAAKKLGITVVHVESGLRSYDRSMPEEINRMVVDRLSDILLTPSNDANENLLKEGVDNSKIHLVGNIMIDSLVSLRDLIERKNTLNDLQVTPHNYCVLTLHRPSNVDNHNYLEEILCSIPSNIDIVFPVHPRTMEVLINNFNLKNYPKIKFIKPLPYSDFIKLISHSSFIVTDSGGVQEESSYLGVPCFTLRNNTERPVTITHGTNHLVNTENLSESIRKVVNSEVVPALIPMWDGKTAHRIKKILKEYTNK